MARKKKAWNMSNPLYRYLHGKKARKATRTRTRSKTMARYRKHGRRSKGGGSGKILGLSTKGLVGGLGIMGVVAGVMFKDQIAAMIPVDIPFKSQAVSFGLGGPAALVGGMALDYFKGNGATASGGQEY